MLTGLLWKLTLSMIFTWSPCSGSNILAIFPFFSRSHDIMTQRLVEVLANRGHQITIVTPFTHPDRKNIRQIDISGGAHSFVDSMIIDDVINKHNGVFNLITDVIDLEKDHCESVYNNSQVQQILNDSDEQIDLIIIESYNTNCFLPMSLKLNAPVVILVTCRSWQEVDSLVGNPTNPAYISGLISNYGLQLDFWQRMENLYQYSLWHIAQNFIFDKLTIDKQYRYFLPREPTLEEIQDTIAFAFFNNHWVLSPRPYSPISADIGGLHIRPAKPLPEDLRKFIDGSEEGVIYFSLGSSINMSSLPIEKAQAFLGAFEELGAVKVLWRYDNPFGLKVPDNVKLGKWFPQRDILEHPNVKVFISHGGLMGLHEALHTGKPVLGIPIRLDQHSNLALLQDRGVAISMQWHTINKSTISKHLKDMLETNAYQDRMNFLSRAYLDRPMSSEDTLIYWCEYIIRYGTAHIKPGSLQMPMYKYLFLDVIAFVLTITCVIYYIFKRLWNMAFTKSQKKSTKVD